jgi:hypothetical protein
MFRLACILAALAGTTAVQAQTAPIRTGTYDLEIAFGGGVLKGALTLSKTADSLAAQLQVGDHESPVHARRPNGNRLVLESNSGVQVRYQLDFNGDDLSGSFTYEGETGSVTGKRRRSAGD